MGFVSWIADALFEDSDRSAGSESLGSNSFDSDSHYLVNPASGLPMLNESIDVAGNLFNTDWQDHSFGHDSGLDHESGSGSDPWSHDSGGSSSLWD
jgi:hypothetical protein